MSTPPNSNTCAPASLAITCAGETLWLLPDRALWWPARRVLWVADLHLGKAAAFRALGQPVPGGTTQENLLRLDRLLLALAPRQVVFLGDFLHAAASRTASIFEALHGWRARHAGVAMVLVRGNHDKRAGDPPPSLGIEVVTEPWLLGPFAACHHPQTHATHHVLAGHVHPALELRGVGRDRLRLACFCFDPGVGVLPAFGEFTGGWRVDGAEGRRLFAVGGDGVWEVPFVG
ncbi:MAG: box helicase [Rhodoferax sp.]|nr:box helicase [Rhodoferax sp.]